MRTTILVVTLLICSASAAPAAAAPGDRGLERVKIALLRSETPLRGHLIGIDANAVTVLTRRGPETIPLSDVRRIELGGDPVGNGALFGAVGLGLYCALVCGQGIGMRGLPGAVLKASGIGAVFGALIDAADDDRRIVYDASGPAPRRSGRGAVVGFSVRF